MHNKENSKDWYDKNFFLNVFWTLTAPAYWVVHLVTMKMDERPKWIRWWGNRTDNLWDAMKEWVHCHKIPFTNKQINISFMMKGRETWGKFIREDKNWCNCDYEDMEDPNDCIENKN